jgi:hypothetical protein
LLLGGDRIMELRQLRPPALAPLSIVFYADLTLGLLIYITFMQRWTAKLLLLFALAGTFVPLALAVTAAPAHACCLRKSVHQCHGSDSETDQRSVRTTGCCSHDCCRAVRTSQSAHPQPSLKSAFVPTIDLRASESRPATPVSELFATQSTRAPPQVSIA